MKKITYLIIITSLAFGGRLGIGISGGGEYDKNRREITPDMVQTLHYGAECALLAEALPDIFLETSLSYLNNPSSSSPTAGLGLGVNFQPRIGRFPIAPLFGVKGTLLFHNNLDINNAMSEGQLVEYIESSTPQLVGTGLAGLSIYFTKSVSLNCHYRYLALAPDNSLEMIWVGLTYYVNW